MNIHLSCDVAARVRRILLGFLRHGFQHLACNARPFWCIWMYAAVISNEFTRDSGAERDLVPEAQGMASDRVHQLQSAFSQHPTSPYNPPVMALPLQAGLTPVEVAFLCEMEMVTIVPRQRLESLDLLGGSTPTLRPPHRSNIPLWLALLLKRQRRANIVPPPWLLPSSLTSILKYETETTPQTFSPPPPHPYPLTSRPSPTDSVSPPFLPSSTADAPPDYLPYHWLELGEILLEAASDDIPDSGAVRGLLRDLREVRMAKMRSSVKELEGGGVSSLMGVGAMEVAEGRAFIVAVMDGLRRLGQSRETARREREEEEGIGGGGADDEDEDMDGL